MKLTGNKRKGRHLLKNAGLVDDENLIDSNGKPKHAKRGKRRLIMILGIICAVIIGLVIFAFVYIKWGVKLPETKGSMRPNRGSVEGEYDPNDPNAPVVTPGRGAAGNVTRPDERIFTFLILATDDAGGNTDTIMAVSFNATKYTLDILSIPRDTLVNVSWSIKKANSIYANMRLQHNKDDKPQEAAMQATVEKFADILGFEVDRMVLIDLKAFVKLIDSVGGVDFNIPRNMNYDDPAQNLHIHYSAGMKHLNGQQALEVMRYRSGYANADIGRIDTQQNFMMAAAEQILAKQDQLSITELAGVFKDYVKTDMSLNDIIWFARELVKMDAENISFETALADYSDMVGKESYVTLFVDEWLEQVNRKINPWSRDITLDDVSIFTRGDDGKLYVTDGLYAGNPTWGSSSVRSRNYSFIDSSKSSGNSSSPSGSSGSNPNSSGSSGSTNPGSSAGSGSQNSSSGTNPGSAAAANPGSSAGGSATATPGSNSGDGSDSVVEGDVNGDDDGDGDGSVPDAQGTDPDDPDYMPPTDPDDDEENPVFEPGEQSGETDPQEATPSGDDTPGQDEPPSETPTEASAPDDIPHEAEPEQIAPVDEPVDEPGE